MNYSFRTAAPKHPRSIRGVKDSPQQPKAVRWQGLRRHPAWWRRDVRHAPPGWLETNPKKQIVCQFVARFAGKAMPWECLIRGGRTWGAIARLSMVLFAFPVTDLGQDL